MYLRVRGIDFAPFLCHWILELFRQCGIFFLFYYNLIIILLNNLIVRIFQFSVTLIFRMVIGALCPKLCPSFKILPRYKVKSEGEFVSIHACIFPHT
jgi:hypothetical protein